MPTISLPVLFLIMQCRLYMKRCINRGITIGPINFRNRSDRTYHDYLFSSLSQLILPKTNRCSKLNLLLCLAHKTTEDHIIKQTYTITLTADTTQTGNSTSGTHHQRRSEKTNYTSWECREVDNRNESQEGKRTKGKWIDLVKDITHKGVQGYTRKVA